MTKVARALREERLDASSASVIEAVRLADTLATMRGRPIPDLRDLDEATLAVLCSGESAPMRLIERKLVIGERLGAVPEETPSVPLQRDLTQLQKRLRMAPDPAQIVKTLDLREATDLSRSHLLHRLGLLGVDWISADHLLARASHLLSHVSDGVGIVVLPTRDVVKHIDFVRLGEGRILVITVSRAGLDVAPLLDRVGTGPALPDDQPAAALWWRLTGHLTAIPDTVCVDPHLENTFLSVLTDLPQERVDDLTRSGAWPAILDAVDLAHRAGWSLTRLAEVAAAASSDSDPGQALLWRLTTLLRGEQNLDTEPDPNPAPEDYEPAAPTGTEQDPTRDIPIGGEPEPDIDDAAHRPEPLDEENTSSRLALAALIREIPTPLPPSEAMLRRHEAEAAEWLFSPVSRERMIDINNAAADYYQACFRGSWSQRYLTERLHTDLTGHPHIRPGHAPRGWTHLVDHLRQHGVTDEELLLTGLAAQASTGRLIDRFRDRLMLPITHHGDILGFVGRRHDPGADPRTPKYLNTPATALYTKGNQLYQPDPGEAGLDRIPTLVEGPIDALAINLAAPDTHLGLATLGTALTAEHAQHLATFAKTPLVATDADTAGQLAAERAYWQLTPHGLTPHIVRWPHGADPADILHRYGPAHLAQALRTPIDLTDYLLAQRRDILIGNAITTASIPVLAAADPTHWHRVPVDRQDDFLKLVLAWERDPRAVADRQLARAGEIKTAMEAWRQRSPEERWAPLLQTRDATILRSQEWPTIAAQINELHEHGIDVHQIASPIDDGATLEERVAAIHKQLATLRSESLLPHRREPLSATTDRPEIRPLLDSPVRVADPRHPR